MAQLAGGGLWIAARRDEEEEEHGHCRVRVGIVQEVEEEMRGQQRDESRVGLQIARARLWMERAKQRMDQPRREESRNEIERAQHMEGAGTRRGRRRQSADRGEATHHRRHTARR